MARFVAPATVSILRNGSVQLCGLNLILNFEQGNRDMSFQIENGLLIKYHPENGETDIVIPDGVTTIGRCAFYDCRKLVSVVIPESVTTIGDDAFSGCSNLSSISIPESVTYIGSGVFAACWNLQSINIPSAVEFIGKAISADCDRLSSLTVDPGNKYYHSAGNCIIHTESKSLMAGCAGSVIPDDGSVTVIEDHAFSGLRRLKRVFVPGTVKRIEMCAFACCPVLESAVLSEGVETTAYAVFATCRNLREVILPGTLKTVGIEAFKECGRLTRVVIPEGTETIGSDAFESCKSLKTVTLPGTLRIIDSGAFKYCSMLEDIVLPESLKTLGNAAFLCCVRLEEIRIPEGCMEVGSRVFEYCPSLKDIYISDAAFRRVVFKGFPGPENIAAIHTETVTYENQSAARKILMDQMVLTEQDMKRYGKYIYYNIYLFPSLRPTNPAGR